MKTIMCPIRCRPLSARASAASIGCFGLLSGDSRSGNGLREDSHGGGISIPGTFRPRYFSARSNHLACASSSSGRSSTNSSPSRISRLRWLRVRRGLSVDCVISRFAERTGNHVAHCRRTVPAEPNLRGQGKAKARPSAFPLSTWKIERFRAASKWVIAYRQRTAFDQKRNVALLIRRLDLFGRRIGSGTRVPKMGRQIPRQHSRECGLVKARTC